MGRPKKIKPEGEVVVEKDKFFGLGAGKYNLMKHRFRTELVKEIEDVLLSDIVPQDPRIDPLTKVYDEICNRQRERQDYFLPIGLSAWQVRQTILTITQLGVDQGRNVTLRGMLDEIVRATMKVVIDGNYGKRDAESTEG